MAVLNNRMIDMVDGAIRRLDAGRDPFVPSLGDCDYLHDRGPTEAEVAELATLLSIGAKLLVLNAGDALVHHDFVRNPALSNLRNVGVATESDSEGTLTLTRTQPQAAA